MSAILFCAKCETAIELEAQRTVDAFVDSLFSAHFNVNGKPVVALRKELRPAGVPMMLRRQAS